MNDEPNEIEDLDESIDNERESNEVFDPKDIDISI
jgi:hypothetical protein